MLLCTSHNIICCVHETSPDHAGIIVGFKLSELFVKSYTTHPGMAYWTYNIYVFTDKIKFTLQMNRSRTLVQLWRAIAPSVPN